MKNIDNWLMAALCIGGLLFAGSIFLHTYQQETACEATGGVLVRGSISGLHCVRAK